MKVIKKSLKLFGKSIVYLTLVLVVIWLIGLMLPMPTLSSGQTYQTLIIKNVSIVDVRAGVVIPHQNVLIEGNRIKKITTDESSEKSEAILIDGTNKFVMPGLWDMHAHLMHHSPEIHFPLLIAHGVTHVREMGFGSPLADDGDESVLMRLSDRNSWRSQIKKREMIGPYLSASAVYQVEEFSDIWDREDLIPPYEKVLQLFTNLKRDGVDFIKITLENNPPKQFFYHIMKAANQVGLDVVGHKPRRVSAIEASNLGMKSFEHARFLIYESSDLRENYLNGSLAEIGSPEDIYRRMIDGYDSLVAHQTFERFVDNRTWYCPTHVTRRWEANYDNENYRNDQRLKYVPYMLRSLWHLDAFVMSKKMPSKILHDFYRQGLLITKQAHQAGVGLLVGSDAPDSYTFHGSSVWDELSEFAKAGIAPKDILKIATIDSATFVEQQHLFGSVEESKVADLLLLAKNPLENIRNIESIETVIVHQQIFNQKDFSAMKTYVEEIATSWAFTSEQLWLMMKSIF